MGILSMVMFVASLVALPMLIVRLPADYFRRDEQHQPEKRRGAVPHLLALLGKSLLGVMLIICGIVMLVLPGQGLLAILLGIMLIPFPGKRALEQRLARQRPIFHALNWIRARAHKPPLEAPPTQTTPATIGSQD
jgi:hypothetical protein